MQQIESVGLFLARAKIARPDFALEAQNIAAVAHICQRLDGIPLAIELAAARLRVLAPQQIAQRLDDMFKLLTGGDRAGLPRQHTLRALIDWSYELIGTDERMALARLSLFSGGCSVEAAEAVIGCEGIDSEIVLDLLTALVDKSLLIAEQCEQAVRYRLLETIRQYAGTKFARDPVNQSTRGAVRQCYAQFFTDLATDAVDRLHGADQAQAMTLLDTDADNLRAALDVCIDDRQLELGVKLGAALAKYWYTRGALADGISRLGRLLSANPPESGASAADLARVLDGAALMALYAGRAEEARQWQQRGLEIARTAALRDVEGSILNNMGTLAKELGDLPRAAELYEQARLVRREVGDRVGEAGSINNLGITAKARGQTELARKCLQESLAIYRQLGDERWIAYACLNLGELEHEEGHASAARALYDSSLRIFTKINDEWGKAYACDGLGKCALALNEPDSARTRFEQALTVVRELGDKATIAEQLHNLAEVAQEQGQQEHAWELARQSLKLRIEINDRLGVANALELSAALCAVTDPSRAAMLLGCADGLRESLGAPLPTARRDSREKLVDFLKKSLSDSFEQTQEQGRARQPSDLLD
jgi:tetratricopeptide (TPR) repeat protein